VWRQTVHHGVVFVDPDAARALAAAAPAAPTDGVHTGSALSEEEARSERIKRIKPHVLLQVADAHGMSQALVFVRTKVDADNLEQFLIKAGGGHKCACGSSRAGWLSHGRLRADRAGAEKGLEGRYSCVVLHSGRPQTERRANLAAFKEGSVRFLICTDVAARGIDVQGLPFVISAHACRLCCPVVRR
jgi:ATP-dependent RNA helicase DDX1